VLRSRGLFRYSVEPGLSEVRAFEGELAAVIGVNHALAVTSGTAALQVALEAMGVRPGIEVIVPAYLWVSVVSTVIR
jgi:dTDP-4-amino-4,6-dideoxygalactose transaminase